MTEHVTGPRADPAPGSAKRFRGPLVVTAAFLSLVGAFGLNLAAGQFFAPLSERFGWTLPQLSATVAVNMLVWGLLQPVAGRFIDRFGPRLVMTVSAATMGVSYCLLATVTEFWQFLLLFGVATAVGFAGCGSMAASVLVSRWYVAGRPRALAASTMGINAGQLLLLPMAGLLIGLAGDRTTFVVLGGVMLVVIVPAILLLARDTPGEVGQFQDGNPDATAAVASGLPLSTALRDREFWLTTLSFGACGYSLYLIITHLPRYAIELGGGTSTGGQLMAVAAAGSALSMWTQTRTAGRWPRTRMLLLLHVGRALVFTGLAFATSVPQLYVLAAGFGLVSFPVIPPTTAIIAARFGANAMGGILGSTWLVHQLFAAAGVFGGALLHDATGSYSAAFASGAIALVFGAALIALVRESAPVPRLRTA
jgi:MFS family permease